MSRATIAAVLVAYFAILVAFFSIIQMLFHPTPSPLAAHWFPLSPYEQSTLTARIAGIIGTAGSAYVMSGVIPIVVWAFFRFDAKRAKGPLTLWAALALAFSYFVYAGTNAEFQKSPEVIATTTGRADFVRGVVDSCAKRRQRNSQAQTPLMDSDLYCRCFGEKLAPILTPEDVREFSGPNEPQPSSSLRDKIKWARDECVAAAIKSQNAGKNPYDQFDKDEWVDVPNRR